MSEFKWGLKNIQIAFLVEPNDSCRLHIKFHKFLNIIVLLTQKMRAKRVEELTSQLANRIAKNCPIVLYTKKRIITKGFQEIASPRHPKMALLKISAVVNDSAKMH